MRRRIAVVGDDLSGGGKILPYVQKLSYRAHGHVIALIGGKVYCDACKGMGVIAKAGGPRRSFYLSAHEVALDQDAVMCDCATPRQIVATLAGETWFDDLAEWNATASGSSTGLRLESYDEKFTLRDARGRALANSFYTVRLPTGELVHGVTDGGGNTARYATGGAYRIAVYLGHRESAT
jgi:hypothetical protein